MGGLLNVIRGVVGGVDAATGNQAGAQNIDQQIQRARDAKATKQQSDTMPHSVALTSLRQKLSTLDPVKDKAAYDQTVNDIQGHIHAMREILYPDQKLGATDWLKQHSTDKLHITNHDQRERDLAAKQATGNAQDATAAQSYAEAAIPFSQTPAGQAETQKAGAAQALEAEKQKAGAAQALEAEKLKNAKPQVPKGFKAMEQGGMALGVQDEDTGKQYLPAQLGPQGDAPPQAKQIWTTIQAIKAGQQARLDEKDKQAQERLNQSQERIAHMLGSQAREGTWAVVEGDDGKTQLYNSKTGEMRDAPEGLHKSGYYAKQIAPLEAASSNIDSYINGGVFDGPGDLTLQHEFFTATQPSTGFRMTKVQQDILQNSQSWLNSVQAKARHLATGTWFSDEQRQQIAKAAQEAIDAKKKSLSGAGGSKTKELRDIQGGQADPVTKFLKNFPSQ